MIRQRDLQLLEFDKVLARVRDFALSEPARRIIESLRPATDRDEVQKRLRATAEMVSLRSRAGAIPLSEFADQSALLLAASREGAILDGRSLVMIRDFALVARDVAVFMRSRTGNYPLLDALVADLLVPTELVDELLKALADDGELLDDASPELKRLRTELRERRLELEARLLSFIQRPNIQPIVNDRIVTLRNRRFVLALKPNYAEKLEGVVQDRSVSGETLFVEPAWAVELNNRLMMLEREIEAEERRILAFLTALVRAYAAELNTTFQALVRLDVLNACAIFAEHYQCIEPKLLDSGVALYDARHPVLLISGHEVVPIDLVIEPPKRGIVISGPNTGGKTAALKTLGLLCAMAQSGLLIPARPGSALAVFKTLFADIGDQQSLEASLSTYSAHISNLVELLRNLEEPALVILDEPGAGTDPSEGGALTVGLIEYLSAYQALIAIATHSIMVKLYAHGRDDLEAAAVDFDMERLLPRFKLKPNTIGQSYGLEIARRLGIPEPIIQRARAAQPLSSELLDQALAKLEKQREALAARIEELEELKRKLNEERLKNDTEAQRARQQAAAERQRLRERVEALISDITRQGSELLSELKAARKSRTELNRFSAVARQAVTTLLGPPDEKEEDERRELKVGDLVRLRDANLFGELVSLEPGRAVVSRGGVKIEVAPERLRYVPRTKSERKTGSVQLSVEGRSAVRELNLIGTTVTDALRKLEQFLDQAYLAAEAEVRIVHGHGSGALRKAIHEYLASSSYCASFHEAEPTEGGSAVTVVKLAQ